MTVELLRWALTGLITILVVVNWFWIKQWIASKDYREKEWERQGGLVTRNLYFAWCKEQQSKCPACGTAKMLGEWRNGMGADGGPLTKGEHTTICKEVIEAFGERLCQEFEHHRNLMAGELKLLRTEVALVKSEIAKDVLEGMTKMKNELLKEMNNIENRAK